MDYEDFVKAFRKEEENMTNKSNSKSRKKQRRTD